MSTSQKRITKELQECMNNPPKGIEISVSDTDLHSWTATLEGPPGTIYSGGVFKLSIVLPADYPFKAPQVTFGTRIYHPNVTNDNVGSICLAMLKSENWKPASKIHAVLDAVRQLLVEPNPDDPLEPRIADEYRSNPDEFKKTAKSYVARYALAKK
ncbi:ubiquitin-conjugating enzyme [Jackrogersella minutella]|nr:ubiquitin-conjugating enzyme [Jackrogersella minutella]